jgi:murein DD-endopeptidase MepM/ murein hydrolase activator NlpD
MDPVIATYSAANYLSSSGAPGDWAAALRAWNNSPPEWAEVDQLVAQYTHMPKSMLTSSRPGSPTAPTARATSGSATPGSGSLVQALVPASVPISQISWNRHDQGRDLEYPAHTPILAIGDGYVVSVGNDPTGFGIAYPIVHFTTGRWAGLDTYLGHTRAVVSAGQSFKQAQIISYTGDGTGPYVGNATGIPGHVEVGLAPSGAPGPFGQPCPPGLQTAPPGVRLLAPASG